MKFKTKEELIKEAKKRDSDGRNLNLADLSIEIAFQSFTERRIQYKKYEGKPEYFTNHNPENEWWKQNMKEFRQLNNTSHSASKYYEIYYALQKLIDDFDNWLFDYCFGDVL